jgi:deoxyribodipyrimidine photo-lyase
MRPEINVDRVTLLKEGQSGAGPVICWMSRDQRAQDNWALIWAQKQAVDRHVPLLVFFCLVSDFLGATIRQFGFMLHGLQETAENLRRLNIPFFLLQGDPGALLPPFILKQNPALVVSDFDPLRIKKKWKAEVQAAISCPFYEVDTHNIVPCRIASPKQEWAAHTFRPKIHKLLDEFLEPFPPLIRHPFDFKDKATFPNWESLLETLKVDRTVPEVDWLKPGEKEARIQLQTFLTQSLMRYDADRNDPNKNGQSDLSPYLHFGQIAPQRVALEVQNTDLPDHKKEAFLEELIVRRELADNFCHTNSEYDSTASFPQWAMETLREHETDLRPILYSKDQMEAAQTHDPLWNAAQLEMTVRGKMHGYMRMYWAKKILEWSPDPDMALETAIYLNDKYELDGRDPNGYTGIAWSIGGVHDRAWGSRPIFGKIRYMSLNGAKTKFDVNRYIQKNQAH